MKLFKKLMAGAMAIAMLSAYTVAFATSSVSGSVNSGSDAAEATVSGVGSWVGASEAVFLMKLPTTAAANAALTFTVDPEESIKASKPSNATSDSTYGSVIFSSVVSGGGTGSGGDTIYKAESAPLRVVNMSSVDVTVNMFASLSDTKMTLSTTSGFTATSTEHLYLGVQVSTVSGGTPTTKSGGALSITALGATDATVLKCATDNFISVITDGTKTSLVSGAADASENAAKAEALPEDSWNAVEYTVVGASNGVGKADWQIDQLQAPNLTITWKIDKSTEVTYEPGTLPSSNNYTAQLDKAKYKAGDIATLYVKPNNDEEKLSSISLEYIYVNSDGKMTDTKSIASSAITISSTPVNGVYSAKFQWPSDMARSTSKKGDVTNWTAPKWEIDVG